MAERRKREPREPYESALTDLGKPFKLVKPLSFMIEVDRENCRYSQWDPKGCKACIKACPPVVLGAVLDERRFDQQPQRYKLTVIFPELCHGCGACEKVCEYNAIHVRLVEAKGNADLLYSPQP